MSGEFDLTLDEKSRLMIPAQFRKRINPTAHGEAFYLVVSADRTLWMYPQLYYEWLKTRTPADDLSTEAQLDLDRLNFALGGGIAETDKAGRVVIPERVRRRIGLGKELTVIGARDRIEVWNRDAWAAYSDGLLARGKEITEQARTARKGETPAGPGAATHGG